MTELMTEPLTEPQMSCAALKVVRRRGSFRSQVSLCGSPTSLRHQVELDRRNGYIGQRSTSSSFNATAGEKLSPRLSIAQTPVPRDGWSRAANLRVRERLQYRPGVQMVGGAGLEPATSSV